MPANPASTARKRNFTAAKRALALIQEGVSAHLAVFAAGDVPGDSFMAPVVKYEKARDALALLAALSNGDTPAGPGADTAEVQVADLEALVSFVRVVIAESGGDPDAADSPLARLASALPAPAAAHSAPVTEPQGEAQPASGIQA